MTSFGTFNNSKKFNRNVSFTFDILHFTFQKSANYFHHKFKHLNKIHLSYYPFSFTNHHIIIRIHNLKKISTGCKMIITDNNTVSIYRIIQ